MARGRIADGRGRGGDVVPARRPTRARVATALSAVALATALAAYSGFAATRGYDVLALLGGAGVAALLLGVVTSARILVPAGLIILAFEYAASLLTQEARAVAPAILFAAVFFLTAELAYWSLELRVRSAMESGILARRLVFIAALTFGTLAAVGVVLGAAASATPRPSLVLEALGVGAAAALAVLGVRLARRAVSPPAS